MGKKLNFIALSLLTLFALLGGALTDTSAPLQEVTKANPGDIAWMIVASAFVLLMTPASPSSTAAWSTARTSSPPCCRASSRSA